MHHYPTIISSIFSFTIEIPPKMVENIIIPSPINTRKMEIYWNINPLSPKGQKNPKMRMGKKPWTNTMHNEKPWTNTMDKKILDHRINTL